MQRATQWMMAAVVALLVAATTSACGKAPATSATTSEATSGVASGRSAKGAPDHAAPAGGAKETAAGDTAAKDEVVNDERFHALLKGIAGGYEGYGEVDDMARWVPGLCRMPVMRIRESASQDDATHGGKLFWLFAKDRAAYLKAGTADQPVGQVLVKEAWAPRAATPAEVTHDKDLAKKPPSKRFQSAVYRTAPRDGLHYIADTKRGLYVMAKLAADTQGTDSGWIYGTLTPDGKRVTSAGRVASCMACHVQVPRDRMFGLKRP